MGFKNNLTSNLTNKLGNSVFKIENVDGKRCNANDDSRIQ